MLVALIICVLATAPAIALFAMTRKLDKKEKESPSLLIKIALMELPFLIATIIAEGVMQGIMTGVSGADMNNIGYVIIFCFLVVGPAEELFKFLGARIPTWKSPEFNCKFDGIVYCTTSALVFAFVENLIYVVGSGTPLVTGIMRAVCCFPGHFMYGVLMGVFYSKSKIADRFGNKKKKHLNTFLAILVPALVHGLYDSIIFSITPILAELDGARGAYETQLIIELLILVGLLILVLAGTYICLFVTVIKQSKTDFFFAPKYSKNKKAPAPQE